MLPFKMNGTDLQALIVTNEIPKLLMSASHRLNGEITLQVHNSGVEACMISQKATLVVIQVFPETQTSWDTTIKDDGITHVGNAQATYQELGLLDTTVSYYLRHMLPMDLLTATCWQSVSMKLT